MKSKADTFDLRLKMIRRAIAEGINPHFSPAFGFERLFCPASAFSALFVLDGASAPPPVKKSLRP
jgi:hypothetical protein